MNNHRAIAVVHRASSSLKLVALPLALGFLAVGCATSQHQVHQLKTEPVGKVRPQEAAPVSPQVVTELLRQAQGEFEAANQSQENNDKDGALKHYTKMLELIAKANLDPGVFYNLRSEFERILSNGKQEAKVLDKNPPYETQFKNPNQQVAGDLEINFPLPDRVLAEIEEIQTQYPKPFQAGLDRSYKYMPYLRSELAKAGMPTDLAWLAMVESEYSSKCISKAGAGGMWQFMRGTGQRYSIRMDDYVDERYHWKKSTAAAITYLKELYDRFGQSWPLALMAYNMGEYGLERAIASNGGERDFYKLIETPPASDCIQQETKKYYPRLLATILVAKDPEKFGFKSNPQPADDSVLVTINGSYSLAALDRACNLASGTLEQLNPHLIRGVTPPTGSTSLFVPPEVSGSLMSALSDIPQVRPDVVVAKKPVEKLQLQATYTVQRGETLKSIAGKYNTSEENLKKANRIQVANFVTPGQKLVIPAERSEGDSQKAQKKEEPKKEEPKKEPEKKTDNKGSVYTVKKGDTLEGIAAHHKIALRDLLRWNKKKNAVVTPGDKLVLTPLNEIADAPEKPKKPVETAATHVVKSGECAEKIANQYKVSLDDLLEWNHLDRDATIVPGDKLIIRGQKEAKAEEPAPKKAVEVAKKEEKAPAVAKEKAKPEPPALKEVTYTVAKGDTASTIADKHHVPLKDFLAWNKMTEKSVVQIGNKLKIHVLDTTAKAAKENGDEGNNRIKLAKADPKEAKVKIPDTKKEPTVSAKSEKAEAKKPDPKKPEKTAVATKEPAPKKIKVAKAEPQKITHTVANGESPASIAAKYGVEMDDLYKWNNWNKKTVLQPGQKVTVMKK